MGKKTQTFVKVEYFDDLTGAVIDEHNVHTIRFGYKGIQYEIDLGKANADKLEKAITPYVESARRVSGGRGRPKSAGARASSGSGLSSDQLAAVREWAGKNGYEVAPRGRIKAEVIEAFNAAH